MGRCVTQMAKVVGGSHDPGAEYPVPDPIDEDSRRQRILRTDDGVGQLQPAGIVRRGVGASTPQDCYLSSGNGVTQILVYASVVQMAVSTRFQIGHSVGGLRLDQAAFRGAVLRHQLAN